MPAPRLTRRRFLKAAVAAAAATAVTPRLITQKDETQELLDVAKALHTKVARTACYICGQKCPIIVETVESKKGWSVRKVVFNWHSDPGEYAACGKPQAIFEARFLQPRIRRPLVRVGKRGEGRFKEITWEEALDRVAERLRSFDPEEVVVFAHQGPDAGLFKEFFKKVIGVPNITKHCDTCHTGLDYAGWWIFGKLMGPSAYRPDYSNAKLVVFMGRNPVEGIVSTPWTKQFSIGRRRGLRIIVFDVRESRLSKFAERSYKVPPGTDLAVSLAILHTIIKDKLYDEEYIVRYTNASMLIYVDSFEPVGLKDKDDGTLDYLVFDIESGEVRFKSEALRPALRGVYYVNGREAVTALELLWRAVERYTPEWAEKITGVPASDIIWLAKELARESPRAFIDPGYKGTRYRNEGMMFRVNLLINALIGAIGRKGGIAWPRKVKPPSPLKLVGIEGQGPKGKPLYEYWVERGEAHFVNKKCFSMLAIKSILEEKPRKIKAAVIFNQNIVAHAQDSNSVVNALKKLDFVLVVDSTFNETVAYADIVLPTTMFFEQSSPSLATPSKTGTGQVSLVEEALPPPPGVEAKPGWWIVAELGKRLDPGNASLYDKLSRFEELWKAQAEELKVPWSELRQKGVYSVYDEPLYDPLMGGKLGTLTGEIEIVSVEGLMKYKNYVMKGGSLDPLPAWIPPRWMDETLGDNGFVIVDVCHRLTATNMWIRMTKISNSSLKLDRFDGIVIHEDRAKKLGLKDGDIVEIAGPGGRIIARLRTSRKVHPLAAIGAHATNPAPAPEEYTIEDIKGVVYKVKLFPKDSGLGVNTNALASIRDIVMVEGGRSAQCDVPVKIKPVMKRGEG